MPFFNGRNEDLGVNFRSPAALSKVATTALDKDKAVRVHREKEPFVVNENSE